LRRYSVLSLVAEKPKIICQTLQMT
jgi:hypothetical protein